MSRPSDALRRLLFVPQSTTWLTVLRVGLGLQVLFYAMSLRADWIGLLAREDQGLIRRDLMEAVLSSQSPLIPRIGWIVDVGARLQRIVDFQRRHPLAERLDADHLVSARACIFMAASPTSRDL